MICDGCSDGGTAIGKTTGNLVRMAQDDGRWKVEQRASRAYSLASGGLAFYPMFAHHNDVEIFF